jgi:cell division protein FtsL
MITFFAEAPALPLHAAGKYVAGAYIVFILMLIVYVGIMARRLHVNQQEIQELKLLLEQRERQELAAQQPVPDSEQVI